MEGGEGTDFRPSEGASGRKGGFESMKDGWELWKWCHEGTIFRPEGGWVEDGPIRV